MPSQRPGFGVMTQGPPDSVPIFSSAVPPCLCLVKVSKHRQRNSKNGKRRQCFAGRGSREGRPVPNSKVPACLLLGRLLRLQQISVICGVLLVGTWAREIVLQCEEVEPVDPAPTATPTVLEVGRFQHSGTKTD